MVWGGDIKVYHCTVWPIALLVRYLPLHVLQYVVYLVTLDFVYSDELPGATCWDFVSLEVPSALLHLLLPKHCQMKKAYGEVASQKDCTL